MRSITAGRRRRDTFSSTPSILSSHLFFALPINFLLCHHSSPHLISPHLINTPVHMSSPTNFVHKNFHSTFLLFFLNPRLRFFVKGADVVARRAFVPSLLSSTWSVGRFLPPFPRFVRSRASWRVRLTWSRCGVDAMRGWRTGGAALLERGARCRTADQFRAPKNGASAATPQQQYGFPSNRLRSIYTDRVCGRLIFILSPSYSAVPLVMRAVPFMSY